MTKTKFKVLASWSMSNAETYRRVWVDRDGKRYIKVDGQYRCIENTPCINFMIED